MKMRRLVSLTSFISFVFLAATGIMLFLSPQGRVAYWSGWKMPRVTLPLDKAGARTTVAV